MQYRFEPFGFSIQGSEKEINTDKFLTAQVFKGMLIRHTNIEDPAIHHESSTRLLCTVADGRSEKFRGQEASIIAVRTITNYLISSRTWFDALSEDNEKDLTEDLKKALARCSENIRSLHKNESGKHAEPEKGTSISAAFFVGTRMYVIHEGRTRCYLLRQGKLKMISCRRSDCGNSGGKTAPQLAGEHVSTNILEHAYGEESTAVPPAVHRAGLERGDTVLLCSNGLYDTLSESDLQSILGKENLSPQKMCYSLLNEAEKKGNKDDATAVVVAVKRDTAV